MHAWGDEAAVAAVLQDHRQAPIEERLRVMLTFLEKQTLRPAELGPEDIKPLRAAGLSDRAIEEALYVSFCFNMIDRLADTLDFPLASPAVQKKSVQLLTRLGYGYSSIPG